MTMGKIGFASLIQSIVQQTDIGVGVGIASFVESLLEANTAMIGHQITSVKVLPADAA